MSIYPKILCGVIAGPARAAVRETASADFNDAQPTSQ